MAVFLCGAIANAQTATMPKAGESKRLPSGIEVAWIPAGEFMMGSTEDEIDTIVKECYRYNKVCKREWWTNESPRHSITIKNGFWLGKYEITQAQWKEVMGKNPSFFSTCGNDCPVDHINWDDIQIFLQKLNARNDGYFYRMPSEAEWEYASRAGGQTSFGFGAILTSKQANLSGRFTFASDEKGPVLGKTIKVGSYAPNAWGLYDMHGNVWEWVEDIYNPSYDGLPADGTANLKIGDARLRVMRGGSWFYSALLCRSAERGRVAANDTVNDYGFRVAAVPK